MTSNQKPTDPLEQVSEEMHKEDTLEGNNSSPVIKERIVPQTIPVPSTKIDDITLSVLSTRMSSSEIFDKIAATEKDMAQETGNSVKREVLDNTLMALNALIAGSFNKEQWNDFFDNGGSDLRQYVIGEGGKQIKINKRARKLQDDNLILTGENALAFLDQETGKGIAHTVALWNSGLILELRPFTEKEILNNYLTITRRRVELGNSTRGSIFTGDDVYLVMDIVSFILDHVKSCSLKKWNKQLLRETILVLDIPVLLAGALAVQYPEGYPVYHPCINTVKGDCTYVAESTVDDLGGFIPDSMLDFSTLPWTDFNKLKPSDKVHMSAGFGEHTLEEVKAYQANVNELTAGPVEVFKNDRISIACRLRTPTLQEYDSSGKQWVSEITALVERAVAMNAGESPDERANIKAKFLGDYSSVLSILKNTPWIDRLEYTTADGQVRYTNYGSGIKTVLEGFNKYEGAAVKLEEGLLAYKSAKTITFTGLANFKCPSCGTNQVGREATNPTLIPANMVGFFFITTEFALATKGIA